MNRCSCGNPAADGSAQCERCAALHVLGLEANATEDQIRAAYRVLAKTWHPDGFQKTPAMMEAAASKLEAIETAYFSLHSVSSDNRWQPSPPPLVDSASTAGPEKATAPPGKMPEMDPALVQPLLGEKQASSGFKGFIHKASSYLLRRAIKRIAILCLLAIFGFLMKQAGWIKVDRNLINQIKGKDAPSEVKQDSRVSKRSTAPQKTAKREPGKSQPEKIILKPYITVGLTRDEVIAVQGAPTSSSDDKLVYNTSEIYFKNGFVNGWKVDRTASPLRVKLWLSAPVSDTVDYIALGSTRDEVLKVEGTPSLLTDDKFGYDGAEVYFRKDRVIGWKNDPGSLPLRTLTR